MRIACSPHDYLNFVLDVRRYAEVDDKISHIGWVRTQGTVTRFSFRPRLPGIRLPAAPAVSEMRLTPEVCVDVELPRIARNLLNRWVAGFRARFSVVPTPDGGICATRAITFAFISPLARTIEDTLQRTLPISVKRELTLTRDLLQA